MEVRKISYMEIRSQNFTKRGYEENEDCGMRKKKSEFCLGYERY